MIITHKFNKIAKNIIYSLKPKEIKSIIGRSRLKFTYKQINDYVQILFAHSQTQKTFRYIYQNSKVKVDYTVFMKNIQLFCKLFEFLFNKINSLLDIKPSSLFNTVDTTIIKEKQSSFITQKDWDLKRVTTRINKKEKIYTCGSKGLFFLNRKKQIYYAKLLNINDSDMNILKDTSLYKSQLKGFLLADRGFSNKLVRTRLSADKNNIFNYNKAYCRLISPYRKSEKKELTKKEIKLYKRRWKIEVLFGKIKHNYSSNKLKLKGKYCKTIKKAKFYSTLICHNLSTVK